MFYSPTAASPSMRRDNWVAAIADQCGAFEFDFPKDDFEGSLDIRSVGRFRCARVMQTTKRTTRLPGHIRSTDAQNYYVMLQVAGKSQIEQFGRVAEMFAGDITIVDANAPLTFQFNRRNIHLSLHVPKTELVERIANLPSILATKLPKQRRTLLNSLIGSAFHSGDADDDAQAQVVSDAIVGLLSTGWSPPARADLIQEAQHPQAHLLAVVQCFVLEHLDDENLSIQTIAHHVGISERQIHRIFQAYGQTVCQWIRQSRLDRCAADFRDPKERARSITEIAFRWGFNDSAHFSRVFRAEFGQPPRSYREAALAN